MLQIEFYVSAIFIDKLRVSKFVIHEIRRVHAFSRELHCNDILTNLFFRIETFSFAT